MNHKYTNWQTQETLFAQSILTNIYPDELTQIFKGDQTHISKRLAIYQNNVRHYTLQALSAAYPICEQVVGKDFFQALAREYWKTHPSQSGDLHLYGEQLPIFIKTFEHTQALPYLADLAKLEWACHQAYFAKDEAQLTNESWHQALANPDITLNMSNISLIDPLPIITSEYPIVDIWHQHQHTPTNFNINWQSSQTALVFRKKHQIGVCEISKADIYFLNACQNQATLLAAIESALSLDPTWQIATRLQHFFDVQLFTPKQES